MGSRRACVRLQHRNSIANEAIPTACDGFDKAGLGRVISKYLAELPGHDIEALVHFNVCRVVPEALSQLFLGNDFAAALKQNQQHLEWQTLNFEANTCLPQNAERHRYLECVEEVGFYLGKSLIGCSHTFDCSDLLG